MTWNPSETNFKKAVLEDLKKLPRTWFIKTMERGRHGTPDLLICLNGTFVAIELKREKGKTTKIQELTLDRIAGAKGLAFVATPSSWSSQYKILADRCPHAVC